MTTVAALESCYWLYCSPQGVLYGTSSTQTQVVFAEGVAVSAQQVVAEFLRDAVQPHLGSVLPRPLLGIIANYAAWPLLWT